MRTMVPVGGFRITGDRRGELFTVTGACVALVLYDDVNRIGGMIHIVLPGGERRSDRNEESCYADTGIPALIGEMVSQGADRDNFSAMIAGGGSLFGSSIGGENITAVSALLNEYGIPIAYRDVGGQNARRVRFQVDGGRMLTQCIVSPGSQSTQCARSIFPPAQVG